MMRSKREEISTKAFKVLTKKKRAKVFSKRNKETVKNDLRQNDE